MSNRLKIDNAVNMEQLLEFQVVFPDEKPLTVEDYLKGGSKTHILNAAAFLLSFKNYNSKFDDNSELLNMFFCEENIAFANELHDRIKTIENAGQKVSIINSYSSLKLFEYFFSKPEEPEEQSHAKFEINLFKAYLVLNSEFTKAQEKAFESTESLEGDLKISMMLFCMDYPIADKTHYDIYVVWITQIIKAIYLFQYLEQSPKMGPILKAFLTRFNSNTWQEYLKKLLPLTFPAITNERESHTDIIVEQDDKFEESCNFIESLIIKETDELDENDFLTTRATPFYKVNEGVYRIIFNLFVVEKIFKGVYFLLRDVNDTLPVGEKIPGLKGIYCHEFSEKTLLYKIMDIIYSDKYLKFTGQELADMKINGAPDYYIRVGHDVLLFESKDFLIRADKKSSFDYNIYDEEFAKTLYYEKLPNGKEKAGAVMQLIGSIKKLLKNEFQVDKNYHYKNIFIYPILITHDHQYDTPGFNDLINSWFQDELQVLAQEGFFINHIKPITVVNIDSLVYHQVSLTEDIPLHKLLDAYHKKIKVNKILKFKSYEEAEDYRLGLAIPFSLFVDNYFKNLKIKKLPPIMEIIEPALLKDEGNYKE